MNEKTRPFTSQAMSRRTFLHTTGGLVAGSALLAACGSATTGSTTGNAITLNLWTYAAGEAGTEQAFKRYAAEYSKIQPNVTIKVSWVPGDYGTKLNTGLLSPNPPDIFALGPGATTDRVKSGQIAALDDIYTDAVKSMFSPADLQINTINNHLYGIKMIDDPMVLYYRKSLLSAAGIAPPQTFNDLLTAAKKLTTSRVKGLFIGNDSGLNGNILLGLLPRSANQDFIVDNKIAFDTEQTVAVYSKARELVNSNALLLGAPTDWYDPGAFAQGLTAMQWTGLWAMPAIKKALGDDFGVVPWPAFDASGTPAVVSGGWSQVVSAKSKHLAEAKAFVKWLWVDNAKDQQDWSLSYGFHVPVIAQVAAAADPLKSGPALEVVQYQSKYGKNFPPTWDSLMGTALTTAVSNICKNNADAKTEIHTAALACQKELDILLK